MELGFRHAALFGGLGGAFVFAVVAITGASVGVTYLLLLVTAFVLILGIPLIADPELRDGVRRGRRRATLKQNR